MVVIKDKLKVKIIEHHNEVRVFFIVYLIIMFIFKILPILIRDYGQNLKPGENIALVRFDTYANILVPKDIQADEIETLDHLVEYVKILFFIKNLYRFL
jgi:hypothetical protein